MPVPRRLAAVLAIATLALGPAVAQEGRTPDNAADRAFADAARDLAAGLRETRPTGDTDQDFVRMMLPHHQAAVDMAKAELRYGTDPMLKALAQDMVGVRDREIAMMKAWEDRHPR